MSKDTAFARTEYWLLHFDTYNLYTHILSVRFRAHPRVGRRLRLRLRDPRGFNPFCADDNWLDVTGPNCKENFQVQTFECVPDNVNKGISSIFSFLIIDS